MSEQETETEWTGVDQAPNGAEAELMAGFLRDHGIPSRVVDLSFHMAPNQSEALTEIEIAVPTDRAEDARAVLAKRNKAFEGSEEGAETVLTDDGPADIDTSEGS